MHKPHEKRVITYGTFDLFHYGHVQLLRRLRAMGDSLIVAVSTDAFNAAKGKTARMDFEQRSALIAACRYVDRVIPEHDWGQKRTDIVNHNVSVFAMGDDWAGQFDDLSDLAQVVYVPRTPDLSPQSGRAHMTTGGTLRFA